MTESILYALLRSALCEGQIRDSRLADMSEDGITLVYDLAKKHDLAHLVGYALDQIGTLTDTEISGKYRKQISQAIYRCARQDYEFEKICNILDNAKIPYLPLKGAVIRSLYPEPWMRTCTDIDILVKAEDLDAAISVLVDNGYIHKGTAFHDACFSSPAGVRLELHYALADDNFPEKQRVALARVWEHLSAAPGYVYRMEMPREWLYFFHFAHMARHFTCGGCGIRPFLDLWIMNNKLPCDKQRLRSMLEDVGLLKFATEMQSFADHLFTGAEMTETTEMVQSFVLDGGVHGTLEANIAMTQVTSGSKLKLVWNKIFLPYYIIAELFPILKRHKWLMPFAQVWRWMRLVFGGSLKRCIRILQRNSSVSDRERDYLTYLLKKLEL